MYSRTNAFNRPYTHSAHNDYGRSNDEKNVQNKNEFSTHKTWFKIFTVYCIFEVKCANNSKEGIARGENKAMKKRTIKWNHIPCWITTLTVTLQCTPNTQYIYFYFLLLKSRAMSLHRPSRWRNVYRFGCLKSRGTKVCEFAVLCKRGFCGFVLSLYSVQQSHTYKHSFASFSELNQRFTASI